MKRRVVVTGLGVVTSLGRAVESFWDRILRGDSGVGPITLFDVSGYRVQFGGQVHWEPENEGISNPKELKRLDRFTQFALAAAKDAVTESGLDFSKEDPFRCGVVIGSGIGGLWEFEVQEERLLHKGIDKVSPFTIPKLMVNSASGHVSSMYGVKGPNFAVAT
ncbi:MAG: beta-ketoacyl synthase N-terminal-like domain-containing protein, partial [Planctomycetia bacterium]